MLSGHILTQRSVSVWFEVSAGNHLISCQHRRWKGTSAAPTKERFHEWAAEPQDWTRLLTVTTTCLTVSNNFLSSHDVHYMSYFREGQKVTLTSMKHASVLCFDYCRMVCVCVCPGNALRSIIRDWLDWLWGCGGVGHMLLLFTGLFLACDGGWSVVACCNVDFSDACNFQIQAYL